MLGVADGVDVAVEVAVHVALGSSVQVGVASGDSTIVNGRSETSIARMMLLLKLTPSKDPPLTMIKNCLSAGSSIYTVHSKEPVFSIGPVLISVFQ
jgi:hypothetical protein